jgi:hypothetical protein
MQAYLQSVYSSVVGQPWQSAAMRGADESRHRPPIAHRDRVSQRARRRGLVVRAGAAGL